MQSPAITDPAGLRQLIAAYSRIALDCHPSWLPIDAFPACADVASLSSNQQRLLSNWLVERHGVAHLSTAMYKSFWPGVFESGTHLQHAAVQLGLLCVLRGVLLEVSQPRVQMLKTALGDTAYSWLVAQRRSFAGATWVAEDWPMLPIPPAPQGIVSQDVLRLGAYCIYRMAWHGGQATWALLRLKWPRAWADANLGFEYPQGYPMIDDDWLCRFASEQLSRLANDPQALALAQLWLTETETQTETQTARETSTEHKER